MARKKEGPNVPPNLVLANTNQIDPPLAIATLKEAIVPKLTTGGLMVLRHLLRRSDGVSWSSGFATSFLLEGHDGTVAHLEIHDCDPVGVALLFADGVRSSDSAEKLLIKYEQFAIAVDATLPPPPPEKQSAYSFEAYADWWSRSGPNPAERREQCINALARIIDQELAKRLATP